MDNLYYIWKKGEFLQLSKNFNSLEVQCKCRNPECVEQRISKELIEKTQKVREEHGPVIVNSGYRCLKHNRAIGSSDTSQHPLGNALDLSSGKLDDLYTTCEKHFLAVGDGRPKGFVHSDIRSDKKRRWLY